METTNTPAPLAHSPDDAAQRMGIPVRAIYTAIATGELRSFKLGRRRLIPHGELERLIATKLRAAA